MDLAGRQDSVMAAADEMDPAVLDDALAGSKAPERTCIVTREIRDKARMIRFVAAPDGSIVPDLKGDLPGRGLWVTAERGILDEAIKKHAFTKVTKGKAKADAGLTDRVAELLERQLLDQLGLAKKSGHLVAGFEKVEAALRAGQVKFLLEASDGTADGRGKLARLAGPGVEIWAPLPSEALAPALGRQHAVHVAVKPGGMADRLGITLRRLAGFSGAGIAQSGQKI